MPENFEELCIKELKLIITEANAPSFSNVDSNRKNSMKLKVIKDKDGNPEAVLTNSFKPRNCQKHDLLIATFYACDFLCIHYTSFIVMQAREREKKRFCKVILLLLYRVAFKDLFCTTFSHELMHKFLFTI